MTESYVSGRELFLFLMEMASLLRWLLSLVFKYTNKTSIVSEGLQDHLNFRFWSPLDLLVIREPKLTGNFLIYRLLQLSIRASFLGLHQFEQDVHCIGCFPVVLRTKQFLKMIYLFCLKFLKYPIFSSRNSLFASSILSHRYLKTENSSIILSSCVLPVMLIRSSNRCRFTITKHHEKMSSILTDASSCLQIF